LVAKAGQGGHQGPSGKVGWWAEVRNFWRKKGLGRLGWNQRGCVHINFGTPGGPASPKVLTTRVLFGTNKRPFGRFLNWFRALETPPRVGLERLISGNPLLFPHREPWIWRKKLPGNQKPGVAVPWLRPWG